MTKLKFTNFDDDSDILEVELDYTKYTYEELEFLLQNFILRDYRTCISKGIDFLFKDEKISEFINNSIEFDEIIRDSNSLLIFTSILLGLSTDRYDIKTNAKNGSDVYPYRLILFGEDYFITDLLHTKKIADNEILLLAQYIADREYVLGFRAVMEDHCIKQPEFNSVQELYGAYLFLPKMYKESQERIAKKKKKS